MACTLKYWCGIYLNIIQGHVQNIHKKAFYTKTFASVHEFREHCCSVGVIDLNALNKCYSPQCFTLVLNDFGMDNWYSH